MNKNNNLNIVDNKKILSKIGWYLALYVLVMKICIYLAMNLYNKILINKYFIIPHWFINGSNTIISDFIAYGFGMIFFSIVLKNIPKGDTNNSKPINVKTSIVFMSVIACSYRIFFDLANTYIMPLVEIFKNNIVMNPFSNSIQGHSFIFNVITLLIVTPIMEEYIFRKLLLNKLKRFGWIFSMCSSGLLFGLMHGNINQFIYTVPLGMILGYAALYTGGIKLPIILHSFNNFIGILNQFPNGILKKFILLAIVVITILAAIVFIKWIIKIKNKEIILCKGNLDLSERKKWSIFFSNSGIIIFIIISVINMGISLIK